MTDNIIPSEALEGLMKKVFIERAVEPGLFWDACLKATLYLPLTQGAEDVDEKTSVEEWPIQYGVDSAGQRVVWVFTSKHALQDYTEKTFPTLDLTGEAMFKKIKDLPLELALIGPEGLTLSLDNRLVAYLADGKVPQPPEEKETTISKDARLMVGPPQEDTTSLEEKFGEVFGKLGTVREAVFVQVSDDRGSRLLLGLKLEPESMDELRKVAGHVTKAAEGVLEPGRVLDVTLINGSLKSAFDKHGRKFFKAA